MLFPSATRALKPSIPGEPHFFLEGCVHIGILEDIDVFKNVKCQELLAFLFAQENHAAPIKWCKSGFSDNYKSCDFIDGNIKLLQLYTKILIIRIYLFQNLGFSPSVGEWKKTYRDWIITIFCINTRLFNKRKWLKSPQQSMRASRWYRRFAKFAP